MKQSPSPSTSKSRRSPNPAYPFRENYKSYNDHTLKNKGETMYQFFVVCALIAIIVIGIKALSRL